MYRQFGFLFTFVALLASLFFCLFLAGRLDICLPLFSGNSRHQCNYFQTDMVFHAYNNLDVYWTRHWTYLKPPGVGVPLLRYNNSHWNFVGYAGKGFARQKKKWQH